MPNVNVTNVYITIDTDNHVQINIYRDYRAGRSVPTTIDKLPIHAQERIAVLQMIEFNEELPGVGANYSTSKLKAYILFYDDRPTWVDELAEE